ncbi:hypothetical protein LOAG_04743 [Loa loa]|uniref:Uncharacterized protein n=1 Tax=Loa loa TaxID=7209 RepID=A0A1S0U3C7_LOALO|nr:hypothetical protein LOAG_04743 [Loa loa]EFO23741.1 hypothetical protein LOAG_04743 [Loa loa]
MVRRKIRFTSKRHIFKDLCELWRTTITLANENKRKLLRSLSNAKANVTAAESTLKTNSSKAISFNSNKCIHVLDGNDVEQNEQQRLLVQKLSYDSAATDNDNDDNDGMDKINFTPNWVTVQPLPTNGGIRFNHFPQKEVKDPKRQVILQMCFIEVGWRYDIGHHLVSFVLSGSVIKLLC